MILVQQRYTSSDAARQAELDHVRETNRSLRVFAAVVELDGAKQRWTFADVFALAAERYRGQPVVLANSDIAFDESLATVSGVLRPGTLAALTRWDDATAPSMEGRVDAGPWKFFSQSQDTWIFLGGELPAFRADFRLGVPRCENRLAYEAAAAGVVVVNPALSVRTRHHHATNVRSWRRGEHYRGPLLFPRLTTLDIPRPEALAVSYGWRRTIHPIVLDGSPQSFHAQLFQPTVSRQRRLGFRSPFYWRS